MQPKLKPTFKLAGEMRHGSISTVLPNLFGIAGNFLVPRRLETGCIIAQLEENIRLREMPVEEQLKARLKRQPATKSSSWSSMQ